MVGNEPRHGARSSSLRTVRQGLDRLLEALIGKVEKGLGEKAERPTKSPLVVAKADRGPSTYVLVKLPRSDYKPLTPRETEVALLVLEGLQNKEIAIRLGISETTVSSHMRRIFEKFGAQSRTELVLRILLVDE